MTKNATLRTLSLIQHSYESISNKIHDSNVSTICEVVTSILANEDVLHGDVKLK